MRRVLFTIIPVLVLAVALSLVVDRPENWVFEPKELQAIAQRGIANAQSRHGVNASAEHVIESVIAEVARVYPKHVRSTGEWLWNNAGGAMGSMTVLHSSFSEYLIIFGTNVGTEGHTGRYYWAEDFFTIIYGEQWAATPNAHKREVYKAGDQHYLPRGVAKQYRMPDACWALEYARGNIPSMLFFGFADLFSSTLDVVTFYQTVAGTAGHMIPNALMGKI
ncbi:putative C-8 sterol isomerase [Trypanosoma theileri]|uniref:Putative C-8 sterol isomerase n=1 Tax=Trypanosoma theileri TaxID=67003 RepID=A0A1X0P040_9TRYP|nr:putative C-8 sterol isomerase [Trypanosoma theileri]ORC90285.1 putative C-8 sterol isomerase [Trypanosoma theileri]